MPGVDVAIVGGGHNALVAATLLAQAGRSVVVLERRDEVGGAAVSERPFPGVDARLSRYAYLVSLFPRALARALGLDLELRRRRVASYTPVGDGGILNPDTGAFGAMGRRIARAVFPTVLEPLRSRAEMRALPAMGVRPPSSRSVVRIEPPAMPKRSGSSVSRPFSMTRCTFSLVMGRSSS